MSTLDQLFREALPTIDVVVRDVARRYRLTREEQEEFKGAVHVRLLEDDYAILRKFEGRASLGTYLRIVITRLFLDQRVKEWGRWRPSAEAVRLGPLAVDLERLLERQRLPLGEAIETLRSRDADLDERELSALAERLPLRVTGRRMVEDTELQHLADPGPGSDQLVAAAEAERAATHVALALREVTDALPPRARLLLRLRFEQGASIADIARLQGEPQKPLYREFERLLRDVRAGLERSGVSAGVVRAVLGHTGGGGLADQCATDLTGPGGKDDGPSVSLIARPGDSGAVAE